MMMILPDLRRLLAPLKKRIFLLAGRAILSAVDNAEGTQKLMVTVLNNETINGVERFQEYGFETYPFADSEPFVVFLNGNRDHGFAICVHDRRYRPTDLVEGEAVVYTDEDKAAGDHRVHLKRGKKIDVLGTQIALSGDWGGLRAFIDERFISLFNAHVHSGIEPGAANTGVSTTTASQANHATSKVKGE